jgi:hypothetical protein
MATFEGTSHESRRRSRPIRLSAWLLAVALALPLLLVAAVGAGPARAGTTSCQTGLATFSSTGAEQCYTVPAGVTSLDVQVIGAPGGPDGGGMDPTPGKSGTGGEGAVVTAELDLSGLQLSGNVLYMEVGYGGSGGPAPYPYGGTNNGGNSSDIRTCSISAQCTGDSRVVVAGGGGGSSGQADGGYAGENGGNGGGASPAAPAPGSDGVFPGSPGNDGSAPSTGGGGGGSAPGAGGDAQCDSGSGASGSGPNGGVGGYKPPNGCDGYDGEMSGGSGGGGYAGGGGGGNGGNWQTGGDVGSGGGGGSSFASPTATSNALFGLDSSGIAQIVITGPTQTLTTSAPAGTTLSCQTETSTSPTATWSTAVPCDPSYLQGSTVRLSATPPPGGTTPVMAQWSGCDTANNDGTCDVSLSAAKSVSVAFVPYHTLTVASQSQDGVGAGRVVSTVGSISCGVGATACSEPVAYVNGSPGQVTLNAVPDTASYLSAWNGCDDDTQVTCTVTMPTDKLVTAFFDHCPLAGTCQPFTGPDTAVSGLCPNGGTTQGGSLVTLTGKDLVTTQIPSFDGVAATVVSVSADHTSMTVSTPPHAAGTVTVSIPDLYSGSFTYENSVPHLTGLSPGAVYHVGAAPVTVTGTNLFDISDVSTGTLPATNVQSSCDGTSLTFTPADDTDVSDTSQSVFVTSAAGTADDTLSLGRTFPPNQGSASSAYTPVTQFLLSSADATTGTGFGYSAPDGTSVDFNVPAGDLPAGTVLDVYKANPSDPNFASGLPPSSVVQSGYVISWTAPDGSHPAPTQPLEVQVVDPNIAPSQTVYGAGDNGARVPLQPSATVPKGATKLALVYLGLDGKVHILGSPIDVTPGQLIAGAGVIPGGSGNVIAAGSGNVIAAGSGNFVIAQNFVIAAGSGNVIAAGSGNVIAAGSGNVIAAGSGNVIAAAGGSLSDVLAASPNGFLSMQQALGVIAAGSGNLTADVGEMVAQVGNGFANYYMSGMDPEFVTATPPSPPAAPTGVAATVSATDANVSWTAPAPGGAPITGYRVQIFQDGSPAAVIPFSSDATTQTLQGLTPGHTYTFTVEAFNGGYGPASAPSEAVTVGAPASSGPIGVAPGSTSATWVVAGATYSSSSGSPSASAPVVVNVTTPVAGNVTVSPITGALAPAGYEAFGQALQITAPAASAAQPLVLGFEVDKSALPSGVDDSELTVTRDGAAAASCPGATTVTSADPCVTSVVDHGSYVTITVLSTHASSWSEVAATSDRLAGADRIGTSIAVSQAYFGTGQAKAAVLARDDAYPDALAGGPLAGAKGAPLLLSDPTALPAAVAAELTRALAPGSTVYLLGGTSALSGAVDQAVQALGFQTVRLSGPDRFGTAVAVANALGAPGTVLLASGVDFPDALSAGAAAAHIGGAVLLTDGGAPSGATAAYLAQHPADKLYAVGGPAAAAVPGAAAVARADRYATAVAVAEQFFPGATAAGLASGTAYADALSAGPVLGAHGEPLLLTDPQALSAATAGYVSSGIVELHTFGGPAAVSFNPGASRLGSVRGAVLALLRAVRL